MIGKPVIRNISSTLDSVWNDITSSVGGNSAPKTTDHKAQHEAKQREDLKAKLRAFKPSSLEHFPPFQRTSISHAGQVPTADSETSYNYLIAALRFREKYMARSLQSFAAVPTRFLKHLDGEEKVSLDEMMEEMHVEQKQEPTVSAKRRPAPPHVKNPWDMKLLPDLGLVFKMNKGIIEIYQDGQQVVFPYPTFEEHVKDLQTLCTMLEDGAVRTFSEKRLNILRSKYNIHINLNETHELAKMHEVPHRDFYNVLKVDTHIHAAGAPTPTQILACIEEAYNNEPNIPVLPGKNKGDPPQTLAGLFESLGLTVDTLSVDSLDCHADRDTMNRFDLFNNKYNIAGDAGLRKVFLKTSNLVNGKYFGELLKENIANYEKNGFIYSELRKGAGDGKADWNTIAKWPKELNLYSDHVRWGIQVARTYSGSKASGSIKSFEEFLQNIFVPMFEATSDPTTNSDLAKYLTYCYGFDSVDDESKPEDPLLYLDTPTADAWTSDENPAYAYYSYYMHANIAILNHLRHARGMNTFTFRPHCGEAGSPVHLASSFLLAENISHGIRLTENPATEYLYYLAQIPIAMSPLSNNALFLPIRDHPLPNFFAEGIPVTLSTDDPLMFHFTNEPLLEEYAVSSQIFKLSTCDMCELARNSVAMCGFPEHVKEYFLGKNWRKPGVAGNDIGLTNVPNERVAYRVETLMSELYNLCKGSSLTPK